MKRAPSLVAALFASLLLGCSSAEDPESTGCKTGANAAWATPAGTSFALPSGVELAGDITGNIDDGPCASLSPIEYGGDLLPMCLTLKNTTTASITVKIPAGLVFLAKNFATQNGIVLQDHDLVVPAGQTTSFRFALFCLNEHCQYGQRVTIFTFGNVSNDPAILELVGLARGRKMDKSALETALIFGKAVWEVTGGQGLSAERKKQITDLADGK
jgi:hypothetical protein